MEGRVGGVGGCRDHGSHGPSGDVGGSVWEANGVVEVLLQWKEEGENHGGRAVKGNTGKKNEPCCTEEGVGNSDVAPGNIETILC